jgi:two-component system sensor histidine kinase VicK
MVSTSWLVLQRGLVLLFNAVREMANRKFSLNAIKQVGKLSDDGIFVYDLGSESMVYSNKALTKVLGLSLEMIKTATLSTIKRILRQDYEYFLEKAHDLMAKQKILNVELRVGIHQEKYISFDAYRINNSEFVFCIVKDISRAKEYMDYIIEFGARKDTILDMVSHNLSGPLNLTSNLLDLVDRQNKSQQYKKIDNHTRLIRENTQQCIDVINSFLKEEHFASEKIAVETNRFDVLTKIRIIVERLKQLSKKKKITIKCRKKEVFITTDDVKFFQAIHNILSNAVKFTDDNGVIDIIVSELDTSIEILIADNGIGVPDFLQPHVFKKNTPAGRLGLRGEKSNWNGSLHC